MYIVSGGQVRPLVILMGTMTLPQQGCQVDEVIRREPVLIEQLVVFLSRPGVQEQQGLNQGLERI